MLRFPLLAVMLVCLFGAAWAVPGSIEGVWLTEKDESKIRIQRCGQDLCGSIVWLRKPVYTDSHEGPVGTPIVDRHNPDPELRQRSVLGMRIMQGFRQTDANTWAEGTVYDPENGKTYRGTLHLTAPDRLELRGYVGIPLFGRTSVWRRAE